MAPRSSSRHAPRATAQDRGARQPDDGRGRAARRARAHRGQRRRRSTSWWCRPTRSTPARPTGRVRRSCGRPPPRPPGSGWTDPGSCAAAGSTVEGELGDYRPLVALDKAMREFGPDHVVIATQPEDRSTWLRHGVVADARERSTSRSSTWWCTHRLTAFPTSTRTDWASSTAWSTRCAGFRHGQGTRDHGHAGEGGGRRLTGVSPGGRPPVTSSGPRPGSAAARLGRPPRRRPRAWVVARWRANRCCLCPPALAPSWDVPSASPRQSDELRPGEPGDREPTLAARGARPTCPVACRQRGSRRVLAACTPPGEAGVLRAPRWVRGRPAGRDGARRLPRRATRHVQGRTKARGTEPAAVRPPARQPGPGRLRGGRRPMPPRIRADGSAAGPSMADHAAARCGDPLTVASPA